MNEPQTRRERILAHLERYPERDDYLAGPENTLHGIARAVGISDRNISTCVVQLIRDGSVRRRLKRVDGAGRRQFVHYAVRGWAGSSSPDETRIGEALSHLEKAREILTVLRGERI